MRRRTRPVVQRTRKLNPPKPMVVASPTERVLRVVVGLKIGAKVTKFAISSRRANAIRGRSVHSSTLRMTSHALNPPREIELGRLQRVTRMIWGRRCQKMRWQRPHALIMPKVNAGEVTNASTSMTTKLLPPPRTRRGPTLQHRKRRERNPMLLHA